MSGERPVRYCSQLIAHSSERQRNFLPIWSCSVWGLPCPRHYCRGGALLPHLFTLTSPPWSSLAPAFWNRSAKNHNGSGAVCSLWHWPSNGLEPALPDVIRHTALRSSDFPPAASEEAASDRPARLPTIHYIGSGQRSVVSSQRSALRLGVPPPCHSRGEIVVRCFVKVERRSSSVYWPTFAD
jgi:hypothetical protein